MNLGFALLLGAFPHFVPPYSVIDGTLLEHSGTYFLFHKKEEFGAKTGERRAIRLAASDRLEGPYQIRQGPLNNGQIAPVITEGPFLCASLIISAAGKLN